MNMNDVDFKKSVNQTLETINRSIGNINQTIETINQTLDHHSDVIDNQLLPSVLETENTIKVYGDMYKLNNDNMVKLQKHLEPLENKAGIQPPPELTLAEVQ